ncbi:DegV family protein [Nocardia sp. NPDC060249]|uniref:DegV family protein n=1 Tax=Nocardia sp. NPDC060249 TaxID=3347082 RepID=UPI00364C866F
MAVVVVTDSAAGLSADLVAELGIEVVPLHVLVGEREIREGVDPIEIDYTADSVTTSAASPGELREVYERALSHSDGDGVVAVHLSRLLSATWESGRQAVRDMGAEDRVRVVDSLGAGLATGLPVLAAARRAKAGEALNDVYERAVSAATRSRTFILVNRTEQLRKGGRLSSAAAFFGSELVTKPLLQLVEGKLEMREKVRTRSRAYAKLVAAAVDAAASDGAALGIQHLGVPEAAENIAAQLREQLPQVQELYVAEFGPALGVHLGVGALGVAVVPGGCV